MKVYLGNVKLGPLIATISRIVGITCPPDCFFLDNGCYAQRTQARRPNVFHVWLQNVLKWDAKAVLHKLRYWTHAINIVALRLLVGGDFGIDGVIDKDFVNSIFWLKRKLPKLPFFGATHFWKLFGKRGCTRFRKADIHIFASVHTKDEATKAKQDGWKIWFASAITKASHNGSKYDADLNAIYCPEQIGTKPDCQRCGFCWNNETDVGVIFLKH